MRKFGSGRVRALLIRSFQQKQIRSTSSSSVFSSSHSRFLSAAPAVGFPPSSPSMADHSASSPSPPVTLQNINPKVCDFFPNWVFDIFSVGFLFCLFLLFLCRLLCIFMRILVFVYCLIDFVCADDQSFLIYCFCIWGLFWFFCYFNPDGSFRL